jgi:hypothetical protein
MQKVEKRPSSLQERINTALTILVLALFIIVPPLLCGLFYLSRVPDISWGDAPLNYSRIWMHRERRPVGIGYQSHRVITEYSETEVCVENKLRFFLWGRSRGAEPATSSQKMVLVDQDWQATGEACP